MKNDVLEPGTKVLWYRSYRSTPMSRCDRYFEPAVVVSASAATYVLRMTLRDETHRAPANAVKALENWPRVTVVIGEKTFETVKNSANVIHEGAGDCRVVALVAPTFKRRTLATFAGKGSREAANSVKRQIGGPPGYLGNYKDAGQPPGQRVVVGSPRKPRGKRRPVRFELPWPPTRCALSGDGRHTRGLLVVGATQAQSASTRRCKTSV